MERLPKIPKLPSNSATMSMKEAISAARLKLEPRLLGAGGVGHHDDLSRLRCRRHCCPASESHMRVVGSDEQRRNSKRGRVETETTLGSREQNTERDVKLSAFALWAAIRHVSTGGSYWQLSIEREWAVRQ